MSLNLSPVNSCRLSGCTLTGALSVTTHIRDAVTVIHGPAGCTHHNFSLLHATSLTNDRLAIAPMVSTGLSDTDIIFGGEETLARTLATVISRKPGAVFVLSTCVVETIGDDIGTVCSVAGEKSGIPVVVIPTAGFLGGSFQDGVNNALVAVAGMAECSVNGPGAVSSSSRSGMLVNIIGEKNLEYEVEENYAEVMRLLGMLGLAVNVRFVHDMDVARIGVLGAAQLNVLRDPTLEPVGVFLKERFGIPFIPSFPFGMGGSVAFLKEIAAACGIESDAAVDEERELQAGMLEGFSDLHGARVYFRRNLLDADGSRAAQEIADALRLDLTPEGSPVPIPVTPPVGAGGVRRLLHRWRRAIHA
ncbi:MAG: nitrogenase component 1 [Methanoregula sp.]|jgi:nitrogenase molybdenum-iron protein alpha/beta subunit